MKRPLVLAAHGTDSPAGRAVVEACAARAGELLGVPTRVGYVDVCGPTLSTALGVDQAPVVAPLFLASGYHVRHDVPRAVSERPGALVTAALGTSAAVIEALGSQLGEALGQGAPRSRVDGVVLASAGSTQEAAREEVTEVAELLADRLRLPVRVGRLSGPGEGIAQVCDAYRSAGRPRVAVASHLLAPGVFLDRARALGHRSGVVAVSDAVGSHPAISTLVAARYTSAVGAAA